jgi:NADH dehydrogenase (ubiquinone) flavoprotein 2
MKAISEYTGVEKDEITPDGLFSMSEVECLGACVNAPMMQVNNEWVYEVRNRLIFRITYQFNFRI